MAPIYHCTVCNEEFDSKTERNDHFRNDCKRSVSLTDAEATIHRIERIDDKFTCPRCPKTFTRSDNLNRHRKVCITKDGTESNSSSNEEWRKLIL